LIEKALSEAARKALEMEPQIEQFFSEAHRRSYDRGKAEGKAEGEAEGEVKGEAKGEAKALMRILKRRGMAITDEQQHQIVACTDLATLDRWLDRALFVVSVDELLA
jgi:flagellar biosynthesis/type III secretory pathway protein FliH